LSTIQQRFHQRRMTVKRRRHPDFHPWMSKRDSTDQTREVAFQMEAKCKKIRDYLDFANALLNETRGCGGKVGFAKLQEGGLDAGKSSGLSQVGSDFAHSFVGGFDAGTVRKNNDAAQAGGPPFQPSTRRAQPESVWPCDNGPSSPSDGVPFSQTQGTSSLSTAVSPGL
jgi:hypothetical protein